GCRVSGRGPVYMGCTRADVHWTSTGVLLGCLSTLLAVGLAALAVARPGQLVARDRALPLRRLQSGHVGDYVAWLLVGAAALGALALPGVLGG
ncbi:NADH-quinone oxidoreductase subunit D, partial [Streptomyces sp. NPDC002763]